MGKSILTMSLLKESYGVCRLDKATTVPEWALKGTFTSVTRTADELSIVCEMNLVQAGVVCEENWRVLKVEGPLDFALVGILSAISKVLADCGVSIFTISTYDTDYILVKEEDLEMAVTELKRANYQVAEEI